MLGPRLYGSKIILALCLLSPADAIFAADTVAKPMVMNEDVGVPVFPDDIEDRPYDVVGTVQAKVRKGTIFSKDASQAKIYKGLWEKALKLGADAVVKASYGDSHVTAFSWGSVTATGQAIKFRR